MTAVLRRGQIGPDYLLLTLCKAADLIDRQADELCAGVTDLLPSHPRHAAAFDRIEPLMRSWHILRLLVAQLRAKTRPAAAARTALLGPDEADAVRFSASRLPVPVLGPLRGAHSAFQPHWAFQSDGHPVPRHGRTARLKSMRALGTRPPVCEA